MYSSDFHYVDVDIKIVVMCCTRALTDKRASNFADDISYTQDLGVCRLA